MDSLRSSYKEVGDYVPVQQIGSGSFSVVWKGVHKTTQQQVAIKEVRTEKLSGKLQESLESEISILKNADHPNIVRLLDILKTPDRIFLIMEFCAGGDLSTFIRKNGPVDELTAQHFMCQLGSGLQVLRANNLIHRDLKPQNLLLSERTPAASIKIADFGFARSLQPQGLAETLCGSPLYMAPEILQCQKYDAKADLWSVGAILFELVTGRPPFGGQNHVHLLQNIKKSEAVVPKDISQRLSPNCMGLIRSLLKRNPVERLSFEEFFAHPFLNLSSNLESDLASLEPGRQQTADRRQAQEENKATSRQPNVEPLFAHDGAVQQEAREADAPSTGVQNPRSDQVARPSDQDLQQALTKQLMGLNTGTAVHADVAYPTPAGGQTRGEANVASSSGSAMDSMEMLEREYVVVDPPSETASPQRIFHMSPSPSSSPSRGNRRCGTLDPSSSPQHFIRGSPSPSSSPSRPLKPPPAAGAVLSGNTTTSGELGYISSPSPSSSPGHRVGAGALSSSSSQELSSQHFQTQTQTHALQAQQLHHPLPVCQNLGAQNYPYIPQIVHRGSAGALPTATAPQWGYPPNAGAPTVSPVSLKEHVPTPTEVPATEGGEKHHPAARLSRLRSSALCISDLAFQKMEAGWNHEALSLQLLCLVIWREALRVCHSWAAESTGGEEGTSQGAREGVSDPALDAARWCDEVEREYLAAVDKGEAVASRLRPDDPAPIPDAAESVYQAALSLGRAGAVEELMGRTTAAESSYDRSLCLLSFLMNEAPKLPLSPPLPTFTQEEAQRLQRYADGISVRRWHRAQGGDAQGHVTPVPVLHS